MFTPITASEQQVKQDRRKINRRYCLFPTHPCLDLYMKFMRHFISGDQICWGQLPGWPLPGRIKAEWANPRLKSGRRKEAGGPGQPRCVMKLRDDSHRQPPLNTPSPKAGLWGNHWELWCPCPAAGRGWATEPQLLTAPCSPGTSLALFPGRLVSPPPPPSPNLIWSPSGGCRAPSPSKQSQVSCSHWTWTCQWATAVPSRQT